MFMLMTTTDRGRRPTGRVWVYGSEFIALVIQIELKEYLLCDFWYILFSNEGH